MPIQKKSLKSKPGKTQKAGVSKKMPAKSLVANKAVNLKAAHFPPDPC